MEALLATRWRRGRSVLALLAASATVGTALAVAPIPDHKTLVFPTLVPKSGHGANPPAGSEAGSIRNAFDTFYEGFWKETSYHEYDATTGAKTAGFYIDTKTYGYVQVPWPISSRTTSPSAFTLFRDGPTLRPRGATEAFDETVPRLYSASAGYTPDGADADGVWTSGESFRDVNGNGRWDPGVPATPADDFWNSGNTNVVTTPYWLAGLRDTTGNNWSATRGEMFADYNGTYNAAAGDAGYDAAVQLWIYNASLGYNSSITVNELELNPQASGSSGAMEGDFAHTYVDNGAPGGQASIPLNATFDYNVNFTAFPPQPQVQQARYPNNVLAYVPLRRLVWTATGQIYTNQAGYDPALVSFQNIQVPIYQSGELYHYDVGGGQYGDGPLDPAPDATWTPAVTVAAEPWEDFLSWYDPVNGGWTYVPDYGPARPGREVALTVEEYETYIRWNYPGDAEALIARAGNGVYDGPESWTDRVQAKVWQTDVVSVSGVPILALAPGEGPADNTHWATNYYADWQTWWTAAFGGTAPAWPYSIPVISAFDPDNGANGGNPGAGWIPQGAWDYDGDREWCDLPSSMYHLGLGRGTLLVPGSEWWGIARPAGSDGSGLAAPCGDGALGEITSPWNSVNWGQDIGTDSPSSPGGPDLTVPSAGPFACNIHGIQGSDAGNLLTFEWLTRVVDPGLVSSNHPVQFRDHNLDGIVDSGESRGGEPNYMNDASILSPDDAGNDTSGFPTEYPFNRTRYMEDVIECWDHAEDFDQLNRSATGVLYGFPIYPPTPGPGGGSLGGTSGAFTFFPCRDATNEIRIMFQVRPMSGGGFEGNGSVVTSTGPGYAMPILCHEQGHDLLGWPDLYDYDVWNGGAAPEINWPIGSYDLMSDASMVHGIPDFKALAGWIVPQNLASVLPMNRPVTLPMYPVEDARDNYYRFPNPARVGEYFYFWYTFDDTLYGGPGGPGVYVSHTDLGDNPNALPRQQRSNNHFTWELVQADGADQLQDGTSMGDGGDPFPGTAGLFSFSADTDPSATWWDQSDAGIRILGITLPTRPGAPAMVTFERFDTGVYWTWPAGGPDTDHDGIADSWEYYYFGNLTTAGAASDADRDGLRDGGEYRTRTDPTNNGRSTDADDDPDHDRLTNADEDRFGLDPFERDDDHDGVDSYWEVSWSADADYTPFVAGSGTDLNAEDGDTDGDGAGDLTEVAAGSDPLDPADTAQVQIRAVAEDAAGRPVVVWQMHANAGRIPLTYRVLASHDLAAWTEVGHVTSDGTTDGTASVVDSTGVGPSFYRIKVDPARAE